MCLIRKSLAREEFKECPVPDGESRKDFKQSCAVISLRCPEGCKESDTTEQLHFQFPCLDVSESIKRDSQKTNLTL